MSKPVIPKKFLGAFKAGHRATVRDFIDEELSYKLLRKIINSKYKDLESIKQLEYITKFNNEYYKAVIKHNDNNSLHNTSELVRDCFTRNNIRNRDLLSKEPNKFTSISYQMTNNDSLKEQKLEKHINSNRNLTNHEENLIDLIDVKKEILNPNKH